jgi:hypothetical protein
VDSPNGHGREPDKPYEKPQLTQEELRLKRQKRKAIVMIVLALLAVGASYLLGQLAVNQQLTELVDANENLVETTENVQNLNRQLTETVASANREIAAKDSTIERMTTRTIELEDTVFKVTQVVQLRNETIDSLVNLPPVVDSILPPTRTVRLEVVGDERFSGEVAVTIPETYATGQELPRLNTDSLVIAPIPLGLTLGCTSVLKPEYRLSVPRYITLETSFAHGTSGLCMPAQQVGHAWYKPQATDGIWITAGAIAGWAASFWYWEVRR